MKRRAASDGSETGEGEWRDGGGSDGGTRGRGRAGGAEIAGAWGVFPAADAMRGGVGLCGWRACLQSRNAPRVCWWDTNISCLSV